MFFEPIVKVYRSPDQTLHDFLEDIFDTNYRYITVYKVRAPFDITGPLYVAGWTKIQGIGYRHAKAGDLLWVREDMREPANVDVEILSGHGGKAQVFYVPRMDWEKFKLNCDAVDIE